MDIRDETVRDFCAGVRSSIVLEFVVVINVLCTNIVILYCSITTVCGIYNQLIITKHHNIFNRWWSECWH